jgi:GNAT superfamily N-acetyltransferase
MKYRPAMPDDYDSLKTMFQDFTGQPMCLSREGFTEYLHLDYQEISVAVDENDRVSGFVEWTVWPPSLTLSQCVCFVQGLYVVPIRRCSGIGSDLLQYVKDEARKHGCHLVHLQVSPDERQSFYERNGFKTLNVGMYCYL